LPIVLPTFSFDTRGAKEKGIEKTPTSILRSAERKLLKQLDQNFEKKKSKDKTNNFILEEIYYGTRNRYHSGLLRAGRRYLHGHRSRWSRYR
jgi:hypothetical protein